MSLLTEEEQMLSRIEFLVGEISKCRFRHEACPLLNTQLLDAKVLLGRLNEAVLELRIALQDRDAI